jgi:outer membrane protein TolC
MSAGTILPGGQLGQNPNSYLGLQISQEFPFFGKRGLRSDIAKKEAENVRQGYNATIRNRIAALKIAYYELTYIYEAIDLLNENRETLRTLSKVAEIRYSVGKAMQQDLIRAGTEIAILQNRILVLEQRRLSLISEINTALNRPASAPLGRPERPAAPELEPYEKLLAEAKQNSPVLKVEQSTLEARDLNVQLAKKEYYPDLELMTGYYYQGEMEDMWEVRAEISIPICAGSRQEKQLQEATLNASEAKQNYKSAEQMLEFRVRDRYVRADTSRKLTELYSASVIPQSQLALESSLASYESGGVDFMTVLANFTTILEYRMNYYEQGAEYLKALASLEELTGSNPEVGL